MAIERLIFAVAVFGVIGVGAPMIAPQVLSAWLTHPVADDAAAAPRAAAARPTVPSPPLTVDAPRPPLPLSSGRTVALRAGDAGQFQATASIDGRSIQVVVDTGASAVALSADTARELGIMPPQSAFRMTVSTANGTTKAAPVRLDEVRIGGITLDDVDAVVVAGDALPVNLLGMTFLSRLSQVAVAGDQMTLRE